MIPSFNSRIKQMPMVGGFPLYFIYAVVLAGISLWLGLILTEPVIVRVIMACLFFGSTAYGLYVLKHAHDWAFLGVRRASGFEASCPQHPLDL